MTSRIRDPQKGERLQTESRRICEEALKDAPDYRLVAVAIVEGPDFGIHALRKKGTDRKDLIRALKKTIEILEGN